MRSWAEVEPNCVFWHRVIEKLQTRTLFEKCLGETFTVAGLETVEGLPYQLVQLDVGQVLGEATYLETIWVESEYLQLEATK